MYQANSKTLPPAAMRSAIEAVAQSRIEAVARGTASAGTMPRGLSESDALAVANMARAIQSARIATIKN